MTQPRVPKYQLIKKQLLKTICALKPGSNKLKTEQELAEELGASRATVRQAMDDLVGDGYITRWQGKGVFGHPRVCDMEMRIDQDMNFRTLLARCGYRVSVTQSHSRNAKATELFAHRIPEIRGGDVYAFDWNYYADDTPAIICRVETPQALVVNPFDDNIPPLTLKDRFMKLCNLEYAFTTIWWRAAHDLAASEMFKIGSLTPLVVWDELFYDLHDNLICYNEIVFNPTIIDFSMINHF